MHSLGARAQSLAFCFALGLPSLLVAAEKYEVVVERNVMVPMRDGVRLATDIYLPARGGKPLEGRRPAVLMRTPYDRTRAFVDQPRYFAEHGFMAVMQDTRGRFGSEGNFVPFRQEPKDGYDTIEWVARHKACNGRVGFYGVSYMAWVQYEAATQSPPSLKTIVPHCGPTNAYHHTTHMGGTSMLTLLKWHVQMASDSQEAKANPKIARALTEMNGAEEFMRWAAAIPWQRGQTPLALTPRYEDSAFKLFFENPDYGPFWREAGLGMDEHYDKFPDVPTLSIIGWYEVYPRSIIDSFDWFTRNRRGPHYLVVGPWTHANTRPTAGDANFGPASSDIPGIGTYLELHRRWFDRFLNGNKNVDVGAPVKTFVLGGGDGRRGQDGRINHGGHWITGKTWPPEGSQSKRFYLAAEGGLSQQKPAATSSSTSYTFDPRNTVSADFRCEIAYGPAINIGFEGMGPRDQIQLRTLPGHGMPGMPIASRTDVLVFQTAPLENDVTIAGNIEARLSIASDAPDTDFYLKLIDVYPPSEDYPLGYAFPLTDGILRARYRESFELPKLLTPGKIYEISLPLQPTANLFRKGHRIRLDVTSSCFPSFDINHNTGDPHDKRWRLANNTVYHDAANASYIELPVMTSKTMLSQNDSARSDSPLPEPEQLPAQVDLPDPLVCLDGQKVTTPEEWRRLRRPELLRLFAHYMYGYAPPAPDNVRGTVERVDKNFFGGKALKKEVTIHFGPEGTPPVHLLVILPKHRTGPAPIFLGLNFCGNHSVVADRSVALPAGWVGDFCKGAKNHRATAVGRGSEANVWCAEDTIDRGYGLATFYCGDVDPDRPDFTDGVHPHYFRPGQTEPEAHDWGTIAAWAWGMSRAVDYLVTDPDVDGRRIAAVGHSRLGKTALLATALDERIALTIPLQAGCGGSARSRSHVGESVERINTVFPHWFNDVFPRFNKQVERLPIDQNCLVALVAPRPVLFSNAVADQWANPAGQFEMLASADAVYRLLGARGLARQTMPPPGELVDSRLGYFIREGNHSMMRSDWEVFWKFADKYLGKAD